MTNAAVTTRSVKVDDNGDSHVNTCYVILPSLTRHISNGNGQVYGICARLQVKK